jgi:ABC-2 type transport system ATP-binding protein
MYELAEIMELDLKRRIDDLSYGNKKKVGIVQGLLHQPKLIVLDEPTSGLDPLMQKKFFNLIREENEERGATVFFSSHILGEVQKMCNRVAIIKEGTVIRIDEIETLRKDNYKKIRVTGSEVDEGRFDIAGVSNMVKENSALSFLYKGDINLMTRLISEKDISDVTIEEPTLEEIFMHYYE